MSKILNLFLNLRVRSKLFFLIGIYLISLIVMGLAGNLLLRSSQTITILNSEHRVFIEHRSLGIDHVYLYKISGDKTELEKAKADFTKAYDIAHTFSVIDSIVASGPKAEWMDDMFGIFKEGVSYDRRKVELMADQILFFSKISPQRLGQAQQVAQKAAARVQKIMAALDTLGNGFTDAQLAQLQDEFTTINELTEVFTANIFSIGDLLMKAYFLVIFILFVLLGVVVTFITIKVSRSISVPINKLAENFKNIASGNLKSSVIIGTKNEIGDLSKAFSKIQLGLADIVSYTKKVAKGDFSSQLTPKSDADELSLALNQMGIKLKDIKLKTDKENWIQKGINGLDDHIRGNFTVRQLSEKIIGYLSNFIGFELGAVYVFDDGAQHLEFTGSIGLNAGLVQTIVKPGEGLVGKAALQTELLVLEPNRKFHKIYSATGEIFPEKIYLLPMHTSDGLQAVIEFAAMNELSALKTDFLKMVAQRISVSLNAAVARFRNNELLEKTLEQAEKLKTREEELSKNLAANKLMQEKLIREKALLDSMMHTLPDYVYFKDLNSKFLRVSESMVKLFAVDTSEKIIGKTDFDFHTTENAKKFFDEEQQIIKNKVGFVDTVREGIDENNEPLWTSVTKLPMYDETGRCIGTFGISKNVTEIKQLQVEVNTQNDKLLVNQQELHDTIEKLEDMQAEITRANEELQRGQNELKSANEELKSQEEELRVANEELAEQTKILSESEKSLQVQQEELRVTNEELELKTKQMELQKNDISEKNQYLVITQLELEEKANQLQLASQYKSEFLANMSHELRTPLNSLLILSKLLGNNKDGNLYDEQVKSANIIYKSGKDLLQLINEILDLSKIEAGKMSFEFEDVPAEAIKNELLQSFGPVAESKGLSLDLQMSPQFPEIIYTDRQRLLQILKNILSNAFKFTVSGGIEIECGIPGDGTHFNNPKLNPQNICYVSIADTGVGIPKVKLESIFEAFQQADGSISRKFGGTGLGLSISRELIMVLGGEIKVESTENIGSVFTVYLPLENELVGKGFKKNQEAENRDTETTIKNATADRGTDLLERKEERTVNEAPIFIGDDRNSAIKRKMVLIVHPDKTKAHALLVQARKLSFNAVVAKNIASAIVLAEQFSPKAIIISASLNSPEEYQKLKTNTFTSKLPIHHVSRIEAGTLNDLEELKTPETDLSGALSTNIENKLNHEFNQILIVEDNPAMRKSIHQLLKNKQLIVHEAKTGQEAFDMIAAKSFDCIILDLGLPDFSGEELLRRLKDGKITIPYVIVHTARELNSSEVRELSNYSDSIVIKGIKSDERLMDEVSLFLHHVAKVLPQELAAGTDEAIRNAGFKGKKILLVDDDIRNIFAMAQILEEKGIEILEAENGEIAIKVLKEKPGIDLVLMDIMMPVMDGYKAMKIIRETPEIQHVPIITLTAKAMKEDYQKAIDNGANDYISKPVDVDKLFALLKIWLFK